MLSHQNIATSPFSAKLPCHSTWHTNRSFTARIMITPSLSPQVLVAIISGTFWVPYLSTFPSTLILAALATFLISLLITKLGPIRQETQICQPSHESVSGISLGCLPQKVVGCLVLLVAAIFPALFLPLLTSCFGLLSTSSMHSVIVTQGGIICMIRGESKQSLKIVINPLLFFAGNKKLV